MDIRAYFSSTRKPNSTPKSDPPTKINIKTSSSKKKLKRHIESDSEDALSTFNDSRKKKKTVKVTPKKRIKRIIDSSDESNDDENVKKSKSDRVEEKNSRRSAKFQISDSSSEEVSPKKQKLVQKRKEVSPIKPKTITQAKLSNLQVTSKFFKQTSANAVFGNEPVKRSDKKLKEIKEKLKNYAMPKTDVKMEEDADFEAALQQLNEVGNNWVDWEKIKGIETHSTNSKTANVANMDEKLHKNKKYIANDRNELLKTAMSNSAMNEKVSHEEKTESQPDSSSSGYCSADSTTHLEQSSDSQGVDEVDEVLTASIVSVTKRISPPVVKEKNNSLKNTGQKILGFHEKVRRSSRRDGEPKRDTSEPSDIKVSSGESTTELTTEDYSLWVEKYKPLSSSKIIGQQGDKSNVKKLTDWLNNWYKNNSGPKKAAFVPSSWNKDPTGACFRAALLSGPPGVGKTTSVTLVCQELGFDMVEFNASDTRSKRLLQEEVSELLGSTSLLPFFSNKKTNNAGFTKKHVLVMDEVDGMAGNEDRGGVQELIQLIKTTKIPVICMCNDRNHPKIRSLVNYCFDLRFSRPRIEQIKGYMRTVCFKEKLNVSAEALTDIITSANNDVRLVLNHLSMLAADKQSSDLEAAKKYVKLNAWDVLRKVFSKEEHKHMSIHDKCDLFFFDYSIAPLFVQENYLSVKPLNVDAQSKSKKMELYARAADCISVGDRVDLQIREKNAWSLLPTQAIFASYAPGEILEGYCTAQINFPSWLGKYSKQNKVNRLLQELQIHTRFKISGSKESINLDYAPHLKNRIIEPLVKHSSDGVNAALEMLHQYDLMKDDLESLIEVSQWPNSPNPMAALDSKVKAAFTRAYNKNPPLPPYSLSATVKKGRGNVADEMPGEDEEDNQSGNSEDEGDAMIITKKKQPAKKTDTAGPSTSKGKMKRGTECKRGRKK